jgi:hypothetical protein
VVILPNAELIDGLENFLSRNELHAWKILIDKTEYLDLSVQQKLNKIILDKKIDLVITNNKPHYEWYYTSTNSEVKNKIFFPLETLQGQGTHFINCGSIGTNADLSDAKWSEGDSESHVFKINALGYCRVVVYKGTMEIEYIYRVDGLTAYTGNTVKIKQDEIAINGLNISQNCIWNDKILAYFNKKIAHFDILSENSKLSLVTHIGSERFLVSNLPGVNFDDTTNLISFLKKHELKYSVFIKTEKGKIDVRTCKVYGTEKQHPLIYSNLEKKINLSSRSLGIVWEFDNNTLDEKMITHYKYSCTQRRRLKNK